MRGRKPKPNELKKLMGNPGKRPLKEDAIKPEMPETVLPPPAFLSKPAKDEWRRLAPSIHKLGLLTHPDLAAFAAYCQTYGRWEVAERQIERDRRRRGAIAGGMLIKTMSGNLIQNPAVGIANAAMTQMVKYAAEFGFTPSARTRVQNAAPRAVRSAANEGNLPVDAEQPAQEPAKPRTYFN